MTRIASLAALAFVLVIPACGVGDPDRAPPERAAAQVGLVDEDGDGTPDGLDLDGDGAADLGFDPSCSAPIDQDGDGTPDGIDLDCDGAVDIAACDQPVIDDDGDGIPEGIDLDCDGVADIAIDV